LVASLSPAIDTRADPSTYKHQLPLDCAYHSTVRPYLERDDHGKVAIFNIAMKIFTNTTHYDYDWEHVSTANWQKYSPWNEKTPHVIAVDTLSRHIDQASGVVSLVFMHRLGGLN
jgi:hypothetical protein